MSVKPGTRIIFIDRGDPGYRGLRNGVGGVVTPKGKYAAKDEFTAELDSGFGKWYFSEGDEGVTWVRVPETVYGEGEGLFE